jgi:predicted ester cyclase
MPTGTATMNCGVGVEDRVRRFRGSCGVKEGTAAMKSQEVLLRLYDRFNRHECAPSDDLFAVDAVVECQPFRHEANGAEAWRAFVDRVATAFPDARLRADRLSKLADSIYQCVLLCSGTHRGAFDVGGYGQFLPTGRRVQMTFRQFVQFRGGKIVYMNVSFDPAELTRQVTEGTAH